MKMLLTDDARPAQSGGDARLNLAGIKTLLMAKRGQLAHQPLEKTVSNVDKLTASGLPAKAVMTLQIP
jgi:hypothetical protein